MRAPADTRRPRPAAAPAFARAAALAAFHLCLCLTAGAQTADVQTVGAPRVDAYVGPVREVREAEAVFVERRGRRRERGRRLDSVETLDRDGRQLTYTVYTDEGGVLFADRHTYDPSGRLSETRTAHDRFVYLCDRKLYLYGEGGRLAETKCFDAGGRQLGGDLYRYDGRGLKVEEKSYRLAGGDLYFNQHLTRYGYDDAGRLAEESSFVYDEAGVRADEHGVGYHKKVFAYDDAGRPSETRYLGLDGTLRRVETTTYDRRHNTTGVVTRGPRGELLARVAYSYVFDRRGNWVRQTRTEELAEGESSVFDPVEVTYRTIRYFPEPRRARAGRAAGGASRAGGRVQP